MPLTWSDLLLPPINLWNFPEWKVPSLMKENKMTTIELTEEELIAFKGIYFDNELQEYMSFDVNGNLLKDKYFTLFTKLDCVKGEDE